MTTQRPRFVIPVLIAFLAFAGAACGSDDEGGNGSTTGSEENGDDSSGESATVEVSAADFSFTPEAVSVPAGAEVTVTFTNDGEAPHTMTASDLDLDIAADPGDSAEGAFTAPDSGSVDFNCEIHPDMTGQIVVEGSAAGGGGDTSEEEESGGNYDY